MRSAVLGVFLSFAFDARQSDPIFRYIDFTFGRIELGATGPSALLARRLDDSTRRLRSLTFDGAATLDLRYNRRGRVAALLFRYDSTWSWQKEIAEYTRGLGAPAIRTERPELAEWRDNRTRFRVWCQRTAGRRECRSELRDVESEALDMVHGPWRVARAWFPGISALGEQESKAFVGQRLRYELDSAQVPGGGCRLPAYRITRSSRTEFESANRMRVASLGITGDSIAEVDLVCPGGPEQQHGTSLVIVCPRRYVEIEGVYFQLARVAR